MSFLINQDASALSDAFQIKSCKDGAIWFESPAEAGGISILKATLIKAIIYAWPSRDVDPLELPKPTTSME